MGAGPSLDEEAEKVFYFVLIAMWILLNLVSVFFLLKPSNKMKKR